MRIGPLGLPELLILLTIFLIAMVIAVMINRTKGSGTLVQTGSVASPGQTIYPSFGH